MEAFPWKIDGRPVTLRIYRPSEYALIPDADRSRTQRTRQGWWVTLTADEPLTARRPIALCEGSHATEPPDAEG